MTTWYTSVDSPFQSLLLTSDGAALTGLYMVAHEPGPAMGDDWVHDEAAPFAEARRQLAAYFAGALKEFDLPLAMKGASFHQRVWDELKRIPYGSIITYAELARRVGNPRASRAVGQANGRNPISIIVPCHRVIGATGRLIGYGGGLPQKQALLNLEASVLASPSAVQFQIMRRRYLRCDLRPGGPHNPSVRAARKPPSLINYPGQLPYSTFQTLT
ncbi:MAG: methylated-DNA--[protein]-cysteine S-methyltransferase [Armatimonadetes bacterium]|nr:methylated-DNA--[protein]-cysteine S-methyltransferase [Armatimonadota bacterium]